MAVIANKIFALDWLVIVFEYRITKYDPGKRDEQGRYLAEEWIAYSQVGETIAGQLFTMAEYLQVEKAYIEVAMGMLGECGVDELIIKDLENHAHYKAASFDLRPGVTVSGDVLCEMLSGLLREKFWCKLEDQQGSYIHVGWDYYMYVGVPCLTPKSREIAKSKGLFVENYASPYKSAD